MQVLLYAVSIHCRPQIMLKMLCMLLSPIIQYILISYIINKSMNYIHSIKFSAMGLLQDIRNNLFNNRVDSRIFPEEANSPLVFPKGDQPANQMGNGVFLKKTHC